MSRRVARRARRRAMATLAAVPLPQPWSLDSWVDALEEYRGRGIDLVEMTYRPGGPVGAWRCSPERDVIAYCANTSVWHQDYIALHEIAHMLSAHRGTCVVSTQEVTRRAPDLGAAALEHLLTRVTTDNEELEAETMATVIHEAATAPLPMIDPGAAQAQRARRVSEVFA